MVDILDDAVRTARKKRTCDQCLHPIHVGQRYRKQVYSDGGLQTYCAHEDCDKAAQRYADLANLGRNDDPPYLASDLTWEDFGWLLNEFPAVAGRFGVHGPVLPKQNP